jgi:hypothetical protein
MSFRAGTPEKSLCSGQKHMRLFDDLTNLTQNQSSGQPFCRFFVIYRSPCCRPEAIFQNQDDDRVRHGFETFSRLISLILPPHAPQMYFAVSMRRLLVKVRPQSPHR